jgi:hypothetical protein
MPVDINGYALSSDTGLKFGTTGTKIAAANYGIREPTLPGMLGAVTDGSGTYKVFPWPLNDVNLNNGSPWSTSTFRFTVPVAGIYYTSYSGITGAGGAGSYGGYFGLIVNGGLRYFSYRNSTMLWELHHIEMMLDLAAGDYVQWAMNIAPAPDSSTVGGGYRANHNTSTIWKVG